MIHNGQRMVQFTGLTQFTTNPRKAVLISTTFQVQNARKPVLISTPFQVQNNPKAVLRIVPIASHINITVE
jgi:hypothetical protein